MAKKKLTEEQEKELKILLSSYNMYENTKKELISLGKTDAMKEIQNAQDEVIAHINQLDSGALARESKKKAESINNLFGGIDMSIFGTLEEMEAPKPIEVKKRPSKEAARKVEEKVQAKPQATQTLKDIDIPKAPQGVDATAQYDVIQLPSNGEPYKSKANRLQVGYLTAYDENIITSPNLYKDGLVIDYLLKNKVVSDSIDVDELVSGDADAVILFLRVTSYGQEFPIVVQDPTSGEQIETIIDISTLKPKEFKLKADENGLFEFTTPLKKNKIKFKFLTRKEEKQLQRLAELENNGTKAAYLDKTKDELLAAMLHDQIISQEEKIKVNDAVKVMEEWSSKLKEIDNSLYNKMITNHLLMSIVAIDGNTDREWIRDYVMKMPARDSLALRRYINENTPGIDFAITVQRPESLGGGSFTTFLNWDDSVFINLA